MAALQTIILQALILEAPSEHRSDMDILKFLMLIGRQMAAVKICDLIRIAFAIVTMMC